jgi:hypothetical protein
VGAVPGHADIPERIEAAAYRGRPIYFAVIYPWTKAYRSEHEDRTKGQKIVVGTFVLLFCAIVLSGVFVVRRNLRLNRGDKRGASRLAAFVVLTFLGMWILRAHHLASDNEFDLFLIALSWAVSAASLASLWYLALEPFVRRREPHTLITWSRLVGGQFRDPLVGRDLLLGTLYGIALVLYETADHFVLPWLGKLPPVPEFLQPESLLGARFALGLLLRYVLVFVLYALFIFFLLFLLRSVLRKDWLAMIVVVSLFALPNAVGEYPGLRIPGGCAAVAFYSDGAQAIWTARAGHRAGGAKCSDRVPCDHAPLQMVRGTSARGDLHHCFVGGLWFPCFACRPEDLFRGGSRRLRIRETRFRRDQRSGV